MIDETQIKKNLKIIKEAKHYEENLDLSSLYIKIMEWKKDNNIQDNSLLDLIVLYSEENNLDILDVAEALKKDKKFLKIFKSHLKESKQVIFFNEKETSIKDWF